MGETSKYVPWIPRRPVRFTDVLYSAVRNPAISLDSLFKTNADQILIYCQTPYDSLFVQPKHGTNFEG